MTLRKELGRILITGSGFRWLGGNGVSSCGRSSISTQAVRQAERNSGLLNDVHLDDEVISFNIADLDACRTACVDIDTVLHLSSDPSPNVDFCGSLIDNNILGTFNIFRAIKDAGCRRVVFVSNVQVVEGYPLDYTRSGLMTCQNRKTCTVQANRSAKASPPTSPIKEDFPHCRCALR